MFSKTVFVIFAFYKSEASGNCLYSFVSLALVGDNSLITDLQLNCILRLIFIVNILISCLPMLNTKKKFVIA